MKEYGRNYDPVSNRTWIYYECTQCGSRNITPTGKRQEGKNSICHYGCEKCGYTPKEEFVYAINGKVA